MPHQYSDFLSQLSKEQLNLFKEISSKVNFNSNDIIISEKNKNDYLYFIIEGNVKLVKATTIQIDPMYEGLDLVERVKFKVLGKGRFIGESGYINNGKQSHTVIATDNTTLYKISYNDIRKLEKNQPEIHKILINSINEQFSYRLENSNQMLTDKITIGLINTRKRVYFTSLLLNLLVLISLLLLFSGVIRDLYHGTSELQRTLISSSIICFSFLAVYLVKSRPRLSFFGVTLNHWRESLKLTFWITLIMICIMVVAKAFAIRYIAHFSNDSLFNGILFTHSNLNSVATSIMIYSIVVFVQELCTRGIIQGSLNEIFEGRAGTWISNIIANIIFASFHIVNFPLIIAISVFFVGVPWGWLYSKQRTLIGPTVSHIVVGVFGIFVLGIGI